MIRLLLLAFEFATVFVVVPLLIYYRRIPNLPISYLLITAALAFLVLWGDPGFDLSRLIAWGNFRPFLSSILIRDAVCLVGLGIAVYLLAPQLLFSLIRNSPQLWVLIFILYPLFSICPQELLYHMYFFSSLSTALRWWVGDGYRHRGGVRIRPHYFSELAGRGALPDRRIPIFSHVQGVWFAHSHLPGPRHFR
jgi:hypothetical protein